MKHPGKSPCHFASKASASSNASTCCRLVVVSTWTTPRRATCQSPISFSLLNSWIKDQRSHLPTTFPIFPNSLPSQFPKPWSLFPPWRHSQRIGRPRPFAGTPPAPPRRSPLWGDGWPRSKTHWGRAFWGERRQPPLRSYGNPYGSLLERSFLMVFGDVHWAVGPVRCVKMYLPDISSTLSSFSGELRTACSHTTQALTPLGKPAAQPGRSLATATKASVGRLLVPDCQNEPSGFHKTKTTHANFWVVKHVRRLGHIMMMYPCVTFVVQGRDFTRGSRYAWA